MANRFLNPFTSPVASTGLPYAGGTLTFYASGTSTPLDTYSDSALTTPNSNPLTLDSAGRNSAVFLQNLPYKVVLKDSLGNEIGTADPVYASDYSTRALFSVYAGNPNGNVAGTAGSGTIASSVIWDTVNNILYVCTTTGTASTAIWTAVNAAGTAAVIPPPQGYLTPTSGVPVITTDAVAATVIYYTPFIGNLCPIYNGVAFVPQTFAELSMTLSASHALDTIYDVFMFSSSGVLTLVTGPAWTTSTAGSGARGTGASTTELQRIGGIYVNAVSMTGRNGATTYTVPANQGTYLGSILIDGTAGQVTCHRAYGQTRRWGIWNTYNRQRTIMKAGDATANWTYNGTAFRPSRNDTANVIKVFCGLAEELVSTEFIEEFSGATSLSQIGIGWNSTTAASGTIGKLQGVAARQSFRSAKYIAPPFLGLANVTSLELTDTTVTTFYGTETYMQLTAEYRA